VTCSAGGVSAKRLLQAAGRTREIRVGNFEYVQESVFMGQLSGNRFSIVLRDVDASDDLIEESATRLQQHGYDGFACLFDSVRCPRSHENLRFMLKWLYEFQWF
jgi:tRNA(Glu) U13 pseudouridine synthase TruD